jgi:hypothetical protein
MQNSRLTDIFKAYDPTVRQILREVLRVEQQYITDPLRTNSTALREIRQEIDRIIEEICKHEA